MREKIPKVKKREKENVEIKRIKRTIQKDVQKRSTGDINKEIGKRKYKYRH